MLKFNFHGSESSDWDLYWGDDAGLDTRYLRKMQPYQRANHYPGMTTLGLKSRLAENLQRMGKLFGDEYDFSPKTWILPQDNE